MSTPQVDAYIAPLPAWQQENLRRFRRAVHRVAPAAEEGWKWDVPVFLAGGRLVCAMSAFANHTKYNFFEGAALADPDHLFNGGLESKRSRSIDLPEGESLDAKQLERLLAAAFAVASEASPRKRR